MDYQDETDDAHRVQQRDEQNMVEIAPTKSPIITSTIHLATNTYVERRMMFYVYRTRVAAQTHVDTENRMLIVSRTQCHTVEDGTNEIEGELLRVPNIFLQPDRRPRPLFGVGEDK